MLCLTMLCAQPSSLDVAASGTPSHSLHLVVNAVTGKTISHDVEAGDTYDTVEATFF